MSVFNVTKTLYNVEKNERASSCLASGAQEDRGLSKKLEISSNVLVAKDDIDTEDVLAALDPYVAVVNVSGGRAGGRYLKIDLDCSVYRSIFQERSVHIPSLRCSILCPASLAVSSCLDHWKPEMKPQQVTINMNGAFWVI